MSCGEGCGCESGKFSCSCCCAPVTNIKGGIHPDSIESVAIDLVLEESGTITRTHRAETLLPEPAHIVGIDVALVAIRRDTAELNSAKQVIEPLTGAEGNLRGRVPVTVSLYTIPGYAPGDLNKGGFNPDDNSEQNRRYVTTCAVTSQNPFWKSQEDLFGFFADGGLFIEMIAPSTNYGVRVVVRYVPRLQFSPAYHDPLEVMQHYWKCSRGEDEFLEGFYGGTSLDLGSGESTPPNSEQTSTGRSFSSEASSDETYATWDTFLSPPF
jgi:hypothetical protein